MIILVVFAAALLVWGDELFRQWKHRRALRRSQRAMALMTAAMSLFSTASSELAIAVTQMARTIASEPETGYIEKSCPTVKPSRTPLPLPPS